jgi:hypothetical protein
MAGGMRVLLRRRNQQLELGDSNEYELTSSPFDSEFRRHFWLRLTPACARELTLNHTTPYFRKPRRLRKLPAQPLTLAHA